MTSDTAPRLLEDCTSVVFIVYTTAADARNRGYEKWLVEVDNPFFNSIPGVHHYANWKIGGVFTGAPLPFTHFDFQGLAAPKDLERVWFNPDLDQFRREWIRLWGYGAGGSNPMLANAYLMEVVHRSGRPPGRLALIRGGCGTALTAGDVAWQVTHVIPKHFAGDGTKVAVADTEPWPVPVIEGNPLGLDWLTLEYGETVEALAAADRRGEPCSVSAVAELLARP